MDGSASFFENAQTTNAMRPDMYKYLRDALRMINVPILPEIQANSHLQVNEVKENVKKRIQSLSYNLAHYVRQSIESGWAVELKTDERRLSANNTADGKGKVNEEILAVLYDIERGETIRPWSHQAEAGNKEQPAP